MPQFSWLDRLRYALDNYFAKGTAALIVGLAVVSAGVILVVGLIVSFARITPTDGLPVTLGEAIWMSLMRTLDAGTMGSDAGWPFRLAMLTVTLGGIFVVSALIGVLNNGLESKLNELRQGRSRVIEVGHTIIIGWSPQIFSVLAELALANANRPKSCVTILGQKDPVEMETAIQEKIGSLGRTRLVCRMGSPLDLTDLEIVSPHTARALIILAPEIEDPDSDVIKTILAITNNPRRRVQPYHIVAEIRDPKNMEIARLVGRDEVELILVGALIARITAQTCRQSGLSVIYTDLLNFGGDEIYFKTEPTLVGQTFGAVLAAYGDSTVIGVQTSGGRPQLNPPMATRLKPDDQLIMIARDDDTIRLSEQLPEIAAWALQSGAATAREPERTMVLGWNWRATLIINELDRYVLPGSQIVVVAESETAEAAIQRQCQLQNQTLTYMVGDTTDQRTLDTLGLETFHHIILLCYSDTLSPQRADARTLVTLLHLREISKRAGYTFSIVSEMLDVRNRLLAEVTEVDDFIVSDTLASLIVAQIAEDKALSAVFTDLFDPSGAEIYLKPADYYVALGTPVSFATVVEAARRRNEVALGFHLKAYASYLDKHHGIVLNPKKVANTTFSRGDRVIVLANE